MKLPRWLVVCLLTASAVAVVVAFGWLWVTWPDRTGHEFVRLVREGRFEETNSILIAPRFFHSPPAQWSRASEEVRFGPVPTAHGMFGLGFAPDVWRFLYERPVKFDEPNFRELISARRFFQPDAPLRFIVERNKIWVIPDDRRNWLEEMQNDAELIESMGGIFVDPLRIWLEDREELVSETEFMAPYMDQPCDQ